MIPALAAQACPIATWHTQAVQRLPAGGVVSMEEVRVAPARAVSYVTVRQCWKPPYSPPANAIRLRAATIAIREASPADEFQRECVVCSGLEEQVGHQENHQTYDLT